VEDDSKEEVDADDEDEDEDDEDEDDEMEPVSPAGSGSTPDLFANTSIDESWVRQYRLRGGRHITIDVVDGSTVQVFCPPDIPDDGPSSDEEDGDGDDAETNFEARRLLARDKYVAVVEEWWSSRARLAELS